MKRGLDYHLVRQDVFNEHHIMTVAVLGLNWEENETTTD